MHVDGSDMPMMLDVALNHPTLWIIGAASGVAPLLVVGSDLLIDRHFSSIVIVMDHRGHNGIKARAAPHVFLGGAACVLAWANKPTDANGDCMHASMHACMHACVRACVRACLRACVRACVRVCVR